MGKSSYPAGYSGGRKTRAQLDAWGEWQMLAPEFKRRLLAMFDACPRDLGIGGGGRSRTQQEDLFRSRYYTCSGGSVYWNGQRWCRRSGMASAAPPDQSFHQDVPELGGAIAGDLIGDIAWGGANAQRFGLKDFSDVNREPWHFQPFELSNSRSSWVSAGRPRMRVWTLPGSTAPTPTPSRYPASTPTPTLRRGSTGTEARQLIDVLKFWGWYPKQYMGDGNDGKIGDRGDAGIKTMQRALGTTPDGVYGPRSAVLYTAFGAKMSSLAGR